MAYSGGNPNGQATSANSAPVVLASDQTTIKTKLSNDIANTTGTITTSTSTVTTGALSGVGSATIGITGTYAGVNVTFEGSIDNTNWVTVPAQPIGSVTPSPMITTGVLTTNSTNLWNVSPLLGVQYVRVRATAWTSGTANVVIAPSAQFTQPIVSIGSGTVSTTMSDASTTGSLGSNGATVTTSLLTGTSSAAIQMTGNFVGTITPSVSLDNSTFVNFGATGLMNVNTGAYGATIGSNGIYQLDVAGFNYFRLTVTAYTSGTGTITIKASAASGNVALDAPLPPGGSTIGNVGINTGSNTIGAVNVTAGQYIALNPSINASGMSIYSNQALTATVVYVKTTAARMHEYDFYNPNSSGVWIQLFNAGSGVTLGSTAPTRTIYIPATSGRDLTSPYSSGWSSGIGIACTTTNTGSTAPASSIQAYVGYI